MILGLMPRLPALLATAASDDGEMPGFQEMMEEASAVELGLIAAGIVLTVAVTVFFIVAIWYLHRSAQASRTSASDVDSTAQTLPEQDAASEHRGEQPADHPSSSS